MSNDFRIVSLPILFLSAWSACSTFAQPQQQATASFKAVHVIGMQGVKHNTKGKVILSKDALEFATGGIGSGWRHPAITRLSPGDGSSQ